MTSSFEDRLLQDARCLFQGIDRVLLAVSGGADSVAMAHALVRLRQQGAMDCNFVIGHINHRLRGAESDADEAFVDQLGESLGLPVVSQRMDINKYAAEQKLSIETAGRVVRLQSLVRMAIDNGCSAVATAHHKDDLAETMIHRFMRGTGFRGLCGIWAESEVYGAKFIRPMLGLRRADIIQYSKDTSIQWREDASNRNINFTRNKIRHRLLPLLEAESRSIVDQLSMLSLETQRFQQFLKKQAQEIIGKAEYPQKRDQFEINRGLLKELPPWVFYEVVRELLTVLGAGLRNYSQAHFKAITKMCGQESTKADFPDGITLCTDGDRVIFSKSDLPVRCRPQEATVCLTIGKMVRFGSWQIMSQMLNRSEIDMDAFMAKKDACVEWFDADRVVGPIEIRGRRNGDRFWPIGASDEKKVGRFLMDAQLDSTVKREAFIIEDALKILWLAPIRMSETAKLTSKSDKIIEIQVQRTVP